jgi:hypothetical protein
MITHYEAPPAAAPTCTTANVLIQSVEWRVERNNIRGVGQLLHNCPRAVGVELQIIGLTSTQSPVATSRFWPASTQNIPSGERYVFSLDYELDADPRIEVIQIVPASIHEW